MIHFFRPDRLDNCLIVQRVLFAVGWKILYPNVAEEEEK